MVKLSKAIVGVGVLFVLIVLASMFGGGPFAIAPANTQTQTVAYNGVSGGGGTGNRNPDTGGQLVDQDTYIASWSANNIGQRMSYVGMVKFDGSACVAPFGSTCVKVGTDQIKIQVFINLNDGKGDRNVVPGDCLLDANTVGAFGVLGCFATTSLNPGNVMPGAWYQVTSGYWDIISPDGKTVIPTGSVITVKMYAHVDWILLGILGPYTVDKGWGLIASDQANVITGIGSVGWSKGRYLVGETAIASYHVGYVSDPQSGVPSWSIDIYSTTQGMTVYGPVTLTQTDGQVSYVVKDADFSTTTTVASPNALIVHLKNNIQDKSYDLSTTITKELLAQAPTCTIGQVTPQSPKQGDSVTVNFACTPAGSADDVQIKEIDVTWGYGSNTHLDILGPTATSDTFTLAESGYVRVIVVAYTVNLVPSVRQLVDISVDHQPTNPCLDPTAIGCNAGGGALPLWLIFVIAGALVLLLTYLLWDRIPQIPFVPFPLKYILLFIGILLIVIALFVARVI